tara:strand:+ start:73 stop:339 length:267 start_codon:yes stop_codon:yes gene_type:complete
VSRFFGLTPKYRGVIFTEIHDLVYHGGGGFIHSEIYNMPIWLRRYHIEKINDYHRKQEEEQNKTTQRNKSTNNKVAGPNINPSSTYNF